MPAIEIGIFRLKDGVSREEFLKVAAQTQPVIEAFAGYISRELSEGENGEWVDLVHWESMEQAHAAGETAMQDPALAPLFQAIDPQSVQMRHVTPVAIATVS